MALALCATLGIAAGDAGAKKKKTASVFQQQLTVNTAVPDRLAPGRPLLRRPRP